MPGELLIELLSEEIPARMQRRALEDLTGLIRDKLTAAEIPAANLRGYVTPRRLAVIADGIPARQPDRREERRGPRVGAPPQALEGFLRAAGLASIEQCEMRDTGRGEFYFAIIEQAGRPSIEVLPELIRAAIGELPWPKSMRFPAASLRWVRPLSSVICLFDGVVVPLPLDGVPVGNTTRGHRFLSPGEITVESVADYIEALERAHVVLDQDRRRDIIKADLDKLAAAAGVSVKPDPGLLDEVTGLVEYPVVLMGTIDDASMELPSEVLATAMRSHQKYFSCLNPDESAAPRFLFVANNLTPDNGKTVIAGNERVLRARLADARFFWDQDRKVRLKDRVEALKARVYHAKLGTLYERTLRVADIARMLAPQIRIFVDPQASGAGVSQYDPEVSDRAQTAARLAKADLSTGMVGEFPELQGVMGRHYALDDRIDSRIADAIADHYKPLGPADSCPTAPESVVVALADKIETICGLFRVGEKPTGSRDPFAVRRAALGIIRLIIENRLRLGLRQVFFIGDNAFPSDQYGVRDLRPELLPFIADRLKVHLREKGVRHDLISAVFALNEDDLVRLLARVQALMKFIRSEDGDNLLTAYRRASNIVKIEESKGTWMLGSVNPTLFCEAAESKLNEALDRSVGAANIAFRTEDFEEAMSALAALRAPVDEFFDRVTVNADDPALRENRLRLLSRIRATMNQVADFSQIEG
jgi:glycyl-tRNA synthetase beta chain